MARQFVLLSAIITILSFLVFPVFGSLPEYEIIDLGTLGADYSIAYAINEFEQVVGLSDTENGGGHAFLWDQRNGMINLGMLPNTSGYSVAYGINDCGIVVGYCGSDDGCAFIWDASNGMRILEGVGCSYTVAYAINNIGQVVGFPAFLWDAYSGVFNLPMSEVQGINNAGQVVGESDASDSNYGTRHASFWDPYIGIIDLGTLGGLYSEGHAINDAGQVVGYSEYTYREEHAFLWDSITGMIDLGPGLPWAINDAGQVVGSRSWGGDAFYWDSETGMRRLDELLPSGSGWKRLNFGNDINNRGQIVGIGITIKGEYRAFLMTPVLPTIKVLMKFKPRTINCYSKGKWLKANLVLPAKFTVEDINVSSLTTVHPIGIEPNYTNIFVNENGHVEIEAGFDRAYFCRILKNSLFSEETITIRGSLTSGQYFYGMDKIKVIHNTLEYLVLLSSQWLRADCSSPDWCSEADIDQDSAVNFKDFAFQFLISGF